MKRVDELGISTATWGIVDFCSGHVCVASVNGCRVSDTTKVEDARLIAAAPELYECLREAVVESCIAYCGEHPVVCRKQRGECFVQKWRNALLKASGYDSEREKKRGRS